MDNNMAAAASQRAGDTVKSQLEEVKYSEPKPSFSGSINEFENKVKQQREDFHNASSASRPRSVEKLEAAGRKKEQRDYGRYEQRKYARQVHDIRAEEQYKATMDTGFNSIKHAASELKDEVSNGAYKVADNAAGALGHVGKTMDKYDRFKKGLGKGPLARKALGLPDKNNAEAMKRYVEENGPAVQPRQPRNQRGLSHRDYPHTTRAGHHRGPSRKLRQQNARQAAALVRYRIPDGQPGSFMQYQNGGGLYGFSAPGSSLYAQDSWSSGVAAPMSQFPNRGPTGDTRLAPPMSWAGSLGLGYNNYQEQAPAKRQTKRTAKPKKGRR